MYKRDQIHQVVETQLKRYLTLNSWETYLTICQLHGHQMVAFSISLGPYGAEKQDGKNKVSQEVSLLVFSSWNGCDRHTNFPTGVRGAIKCRLLSARGILKHKPKSITRDLFSNMIKFSGDKSLWQICILCKV